MRFLSHHDVMRLFERAIRRSGVPIRMTEGFNPRPIVSYPTALGIGIESSDEVVDLELASWLAPGQIGDKIGAQVPPGILVESVEPFLRKDRCRVAFVEYEVEAPGQTDGLYDRIDAFLEKKEWPLVRDLGNRRKKVDVRPYVMALETERDRVFLRIRITDSGSARPDEVLGAVGVEMRDDVRIRKTHTELRIR